MKNDIKARSRTFGNFEPMGVRALQFLRRQFPTLAEWPAEKWMVLPGTLLLFTAVVHGIADLLLGRI